MSVQHAPRLLVTGATGQLGAQVVSRLLDTVPAGSVVATARAAGSTGNPAGEAAARLSSLGIEVRTADYDRPDTLDNAFHGIDRMLLVSSNNLLTRRTQHRNVVEAARRAGVELLAYTSVLHADASPLALAADHRDTEALLRASGVPFVILRNGWYTENYMAMVPAALAHGTLAGAAGTGRIASAARDDYAAAAAAVLSSADDLAGRTFELAGDDAYTLAELAAELSRQSGRLIGYNDLPESDYRAMLVGAGLPQSLAELLSDCDAAAARGALFDESRQLGALIGRPTTPMPASLAAALRAP